MKLEQNVGKPSRVIHIRNIPNETTEAEIIQLGLPFGRVTNVLVLKGKNQVRMNFRVSDFANLFA